MTKQRDITELNKIFSANRPDKSTKALREFVDETLYLPGDWTAQAIAEKWCKTKDQKVADVYDTIKRYLGS